MPALDNCDRDLLWLGDFYPLATEDQRQEFVERVAIKWAELQGSEAARERMARLEAMKEIFGAKYDY